MLVTSGSVTIYQDDMCIYLFVYVFIKCNFLFFSMRYIVLYEYYFFPL